jgi:DNA-binding MarR family transcriptional regulator
MSSLKTEIERQAPFTSREEEVFLNLIRSADFCQRYFRRRTRSWGITGTQYNVLRILCSAGSRGLTCAEIGRRMITVEPDVTRLLNRLKALKLVQQSRDRNDRRVVWTHITAAGLELIEAMNSVVLRVPLDLFGHMTEEEITEFNRLLESARSRSEELSQGEAGLASETAPS